MGIIKGAMLGSGVGAGLGYYANKSDKRAWRSAAIGAGVGAVGGVAAVKAGRGIGKWANKAVKGGKSGAGLKSNQAVNSFRDPVKKAKGSLVKGKNYEADEALANFNMSQRGSDPGRDPSTFFKNTREVKNQQSKEAGQAAFRNIDSYLKSGAA